MTTTPKSARLIFSSSSVRLYHGRAEDWAGPEPVDLVFTNPYGAMPASLGARPMLLHQWRHRLADLAKWCGREVSAFEEVGGWNGDRECFWTLNMPAKAVDVSEFRPEPGGWYPPAMVERLLEVYDIESRPMTIWDGFMGRATIGKVAIDRGMKYVGVEELTPHIELAQQHLGLPW